jgi:hypothetical protein
MGFPSIIELSMLMAKLTQPGEIIRCPDRHVFKTSFSIMKKRFLELPVLLYVFPVYE